MTRIICGVDVSSETLDARIGQDGAFVQVARDGEGIGRLAAFCSEQRVELVVMEASGGYEQLPFALLWGAGLPCAIANPRAVRRFAEGMGILEKTDRIDAGIIAYFGEVKRLAPQPPASQTQQQLHALVVRLRQITHLIVMQINQRRLADDRVIAAIDELIALLRRQARGFEADIAKLIAADPLWDRLDQAFRSIKGVAGRTVAVVMADMPEIGTLSNKAVSKLVGLAPLAHDSGKTSLRRHVRGGRAGIRSILFVVAELVRRHDPDFAAFHRKLIAAGKPKMVVRVALAHKLLVRLNAKARDARKSFA